ncbi:type IX secretion system protein PorD [Algoriella sp.]|uniref:type IX secretion system protein PorD n=1 Tax=Algoriella sp. TaxID=1872434 RepID=UPI002FC71D9C
MKKLASIFFSACLAATAFSQNLIADVKVDYSQVQSSNNQVYQTLQKSLTTFINSTKWTNDRLKTYERIEASFNINIQKKEGNRFTGTILVQSRRPVFNSTYYTPVLNLNDTNFNFEYQEYEELVFNDRKFSNKNLTDVITFYVYLVLGYDADTFAKEGGTEYFKMAKKIADFGQASNNFSGWSELDGLQSRSSLINNVLKTDNSSLRNISYQYHRNGLDIMSENELRGKNAIGNTLLQLEFYQRGSYSQFYPLDIFVTAKKDEIKQIFSGGQTSTVNIEKLKEILNSISPKNSTNWNSLKK